MTRSRSAFAWRSRPGSPRRRAAERRAAERRAVERRAAERRAACALFDAVLAPRNAIGARRREHSHSSRTRCAPSAPSAPPRCATIAFVALAVPVRGAHAQALPVGEFAAREARRRRRRPRGDRTSTTSMHQTVSLQIAAANLTGTMETFHSKPNLYSPEAELRRRPGAHRIRRQDGVGHRAGAGRADPRLGHDRGAQERRRISSATTTIPPASSRPRPSRSLISTASAATRSASSTRTTARPWSTSIPPPACARARPRDAQRCMGRKCRRTITMSDYKDFGGIKMPTQAGPETAHGRDRDGHHGRRVRQRGPRRPTRSPTPSRRSSSRRDDRRPKTEDRITDRRSVDAQASRHRGSACARGSAPSRSNPPRRLPASTPTSPRTAGLEKRDGFIPVYLNDRTGRDLARDPARFHPRAHAHDARDRPRVESDRARSRLGRRRAGRRDSSATPTRCW